MTLRTDHIAGLIFVAFGLLIIALSGDLPFGTLSFPGAGAIHELVRYAAHPARKGEGATRKRALV